MTTADVVFAYEVGEHPQSGIGNAELYRQITAVDVVDAKTFTLHVDRVSFEYNSINDFQPLPAHLDRAIFEADPITYRNRTTYDTDPTNPGLYFGPYRLTEVSSGAHIVLEPNPTWWGQAPAFQRIVVRVIENTAALEANLLSGSLDMIAGEVGLTIDQALAFEQRHGERYQIVYEPGLVYEHIDLNLDNPILADRRVRQALLLGLDREALSTQLFAGHQPVAHGGVNPLDWVYADDLPPLSGGPRGGDGPPGRGRLVDHRERHPPRRQWPAADPGADDHRRQPHPRAGRAGPPEPVAASRHRRPHPQPAGPGPVR